MFNILESFIGIKEPVRNITIGNLTFPWTSHANLPFIPKTLTKLSGFWLQSSIIAVFTAFFVYIWIVSFIADDFDKQLIETEHNNWNDDSLIFESWWTTIEYFNSLVEGVNDFFGVMLLLNLFHTFMYSSRFWGDLSFYFYFGIPTREHKKLKFYLEMVHIYFKLIILVVGSHGLKLKVNVGDFSKEVYLVHVLNLFVWFYGRTFTIVHIKALTKLVSNVRLDYCLPFLT